MRHLKVNSQKQSTVRRSITTRNSIENSSKKVQNDRNNIGKRIGSAAMPRTRKPPAQSITPSTGRTSITSSNQNKIPNNQNGNDQQRKHGEMETLLKKRNEVMPCMTGLDRVANWKSSTELAVVHYQTKDLPAITYKTVQRSSIQERISYNKVTSSTSFGHQSNAYDFKVPSVMQRNDTVDIIDLTADDASESNTSSITTSQEELYSYLGVVTKSQTNKVETETENKTVKRSSLRVKVKQIALRNQEIYNQLNSKKLEAKTNNTQSLVQYNGHRIEQSTVKVRKDNVDPRLQQSGSKYQQFTQSTYRSTTLVNNKTNSQQAKNNYNTIERTTRLHQRQINSSYQLVPFGFNHSSSVRNSSNKCTVMERFVYKPKQEPDSISIQVNADKYKSSTLTSNTSMVNRTSNGPQFGRPTRSGEHPPQKKPDMVPSRDSSVRPPQITAGIKRKAMEQWIELSSTHPTTSNTNNINNIQSNSSNGSSSYTSFQQNTTTTNISTHRKIQKVDVSTVRAHYVQNVSSSNVFQTTSQGNVGTRNVSPHRKIQGIDSQKGRSMQSRAVQNIGSVNSLQKSPQQNTGSNKVSSSSVELNKSPSNQSRSLQNVPCSNALALQTCSQKNIGNNRISKRRISNKLNIGVKQAIVHQAQSLQNMVAKNVVTPRKIQNVSTKNIPTVNAHSTYNSDNHSGLLLPMSSQTKDSTNSIPQTPTHHKKSSPTPVIKNIAVSNVSTLETSSQQYIRSNGNDVTIEVTVHRNIQNFNSKRASSMQLRAIQNIETGSASSSENNSRHNIDINNVSSPENLKNIDSNKAPSMQNMELRPSVTGNVLSLQTSSQQNINTNSVPAHRNVQNVESNKTTSMQLIQHSMQNILLLPTSSMEIKKAFEPPLLDIQSEIVSPSTDLNENVAKDNKPDIPIHLSTTLSNIVETASKRDSKTISIDDVKPDLTISSIVCENLENSANISKSSEMTENLVGDFLHEEDGELLSVLSFDEQFMVIQEKLISFWTLPSELFSIFGVVQQYVCIGKIERYNCDIEIDMPYQQRLLVVGNKTSYVEMRAKQLAGTYTRESLMSIYLTLYSFNDQQELTLRHIELDRVHGSISSIRCTILPKTMSFIISWSEVVTNVRKYNLNARLFNLESVLIFPGSRENLKKLQFFENDKIIAFGYSTITIWDSQTGDITCKIDTNSPIGDNLFFFSLNEKTERALFLVQSFTNPGENIQQIKLLAINMNKNYSWKVICTHEMPSNGAKITSTATITNHFITTYENGRSFLLNLYNPRQFVVCSSEAKKSKVFVTNDKVITIDTNQLIAKTFVDHFFG